MRNTDNYNSLLEEANKIELKYCPFCAEYPKVTTLGRMHFVECMECGARGPWKQDMADTYGAILIAIEDWNVRAA